MTRTDEGRADGPIRLRHNRIELALHRLSPDKSMAQCRPLLLLHGLGEQTLDVGLMGMTWSGPIYGLDFTGHGASTVPVGGGYTSEVLLGDVDAALAELGPVTILGRGLGAYVALITAAARPDLVHGAVLCDGPGIAGGGVQPGSPALAYPPPWGVNAEATSPDPFALVELSRDVRPPDYAQNLLRLASDDSTLERVFYIAAVARPEWLAVLVNQPGVHVGTVEEALDYYSTEA